MNENEKIKYLEFIQNIITRMNTNSFQIKKMTLIVASALLAIYVETVNKSFGLICFFSTILFWYLDAYYLYQESLFRALYNDVICSRKKIKCFDMNIARYKERLSIWESAFSRTVCPMYILILVLSLFCFWENYTT